MTKEDLDRIEIADAKRRLEREISELQKFASRTVDPYHWSRSITGVPSQNNRTYFANGTGNGWNRGMAGKTRGIAPGTQDTSDGTATVAVTINGETTIRTANSFKKKSIHKKQRKHTESRRTIAECARLAPIGNVE